jgi:hypothetical protein
MQSRKEFLCQMAAGLAVETAAALGVSPLFGGERPYRRVRQCGPGGEELHHAG